MPTEKCNTSFSFSVLFLQGIGVALLLSQAFIGIYSIIGVSWMFVYFRDSFISKQDVYRWAEPLELYGEGKLDTLRMWSVRLGEINGTVAG